VRSALNWLDERIAWTEDEETLGAALASREAMARFLGVLFVAGSVIGFASLALPQAEDVNYLGLVSVLAAAMVVGVLLLRSVDHLMGWTLQAALTLGMLFITFGTLYSGNPQSYFAFFYVWVALIAFFFLERRGALFQIALLAVAYGAVLLAEDSPQAVARWLVTVGVVAVAGLVVAFLKRRVLRLIGRVASLERHRIEEQHAADLNDNVVQGLTVAKYALAAGQHEKGVEAVDRTLEQARRMMTAMLEGDEVEAGRLRRRTPVDIPTTRE
jgi:hypothetical protein